MFTPAGDNSFAELCKKKQATGSHIENPEAIAKAYGREVQKVRSSGKVTVSINLTERNMERHGFISTTQKK